MKAFLVAVQLFFASSFLAIAAPVVAKEPVKTVYHMSEGIPQASRGLRNIRNHLNADPNAKIVVVTHGLGIDFLIAGAANQMEQPFAATISDLANKGVEFRVCNNTLVSRKIDASGLVMEAKIIPSGVAEVANLQAREGFVYLRP
jgi:intracellular sulfur oxidation DsrE/DsrF family protein